MRANSIIDIKRVIVYFALVVSMASVLAPLSYGYWAGGILVRDTHCAVTLRAVNDLGPAEYPDMRKFSTPLACSDSIGGGHPGGIILRNGSDEKAHYELPSARGKQFWFRNEALWITRAFEEYVNFNFQLAYDHLGSATHLMEDSTVPAHAKVVFHGGAPPLADTYYYDPDSNSPLPAEHVGVPLSDDLEFYTAFNREEARNCPDENPFCWDGTYPHRVSGLCPDDPCNWRFWLSAAEELRGLTQGWQEGVGPGRNYGGWGRGCEDTMYGSGERCLVPFHDGAPCFGRLELCSPLGDWYGRLSPRYPEVARGQLFAAHRLARGILSGMSKALPPLFKNFALSASEFTPQQGTRINFDVLENRTQQVRIHLVVVELDGAGDRIAGTERFVVTSEGTWLGLTRSLTATPAGDLNRLPWEASFSLAWNGQVEGGDPLVAGRQYALVLKILDGDDNESVDFPDPAGGLLSVRRFRLR